MRHPLLRPRWLAFSGLVVVLALGCVRLGIWQLHRLDERRAHNAVVTGNGGREPVPVAALTSLVGGGPGVAASREWRAVTARGRYDAARQLLLRNRSLDGEPGYEVLTPLVTDGGPAVVVDRGWIPAGASAAEPPAPPRPVTDEVTVTGRLRRGDQGDEGRVVTGSSESVVRVATAGLQAHLPYPLYDAYVELTAQDPSAAEPPRQLPPPEVSEGPHLAYAVQWFLFALIALVGYGVLGRREILDGRARDDDGAPGPSDPRTSDAVRSDVAG